MGLLVLWKAFVLSAVVCCITTLYITNRAISGSAVTLTTAERERRIELLRERMHKFKSDGARGDGMHFAQVYAGAREEIMGANERSEVIMLPNNSTSTNQGSSSKKEQNQGINQCNGTKYLYYAAFNGFSNQLIALTSAMRIAYSSNRTLIVPPLLPHKFAQIDSDSPFRGRDFFKVSLDPYFFKKAVNTSLGDVDKARAISDRSKCPLWSEVLDYNALSKRTGVKIIDLWDFTHSKDISDACVNEFYREPITPPVSLQALTNRSTSWEEFVHLFTDKYAHHSIASIGDAFVLNQRCRHPQLHERYDPHAEKRISNGVMSMVLSAKVVGLLKAAMAYLPDDYASLHLRAADKFGNEAQTTSCKDEELVRECTNMLDRMKESYITEGSTIYIASDYDRAKECFNEITENKFKLVNLTDIKEIDSKSSNPKIKDMMDDVAIDPTTKDALLDLLLVAMGVEVEFAMIYFPIGYNIRHSHYQEMIKKMHDERAERMRQFRLS